MDFLELDFAKRLENLCKFIKKFVMLLFIKIICIKLR